MKARLFSLTLFLATIMLVRADELIMWFDSDQYNQWTTSANFVNGIKIIKEGKQDDIDNAISYFDKEIKQHPLNGYALCNKSMIMAVQTMMQSYEFMYTEDPDSIAMGKEFASKGMHQAIELMDNGQNLIPAADSLMQANAWLWKAYFHKSCEPLDSLQMVSCLEKSTEYRPNTDIYRVLIELAWDEDDTSKSEEYALKALEKFPDNESFLMLMTNIMTQREDYDGVLNYAGRYLKLARQQEEEIDSDVVLAYANALSQKGHPDDATDFLLSGGDDYLFLYNTLKRIGAHPNMVLSKIGQREFTEEGNPVVWNMLRGLIYCFDKHDYKLATESFLKAKNGNEPRVWNQCIGYSYYMAGDIPNALIHAQAATNLCVTGNVQQLQENQGMIDPLINEITTKLSLDEVFTIDIDDYVNLGKYYVLKKCPEQALEPLSKAVSTTPHPLQANLYYAMTLTDLGRSAEATKPLEEIIELVTEDLSTTRQAIKAQACAMLGRTDEAHTILESLEKAWHPNPLFVSDENRTLDGSDVTCYDIAAVYALIGDNAKACEWTAKHFENDELPYNFGYMALDRRFDAIKTHPEFQKIIDKYYFQWKNNK
jgi:tetratricopeptide (TPR) repeat protein